jgi:hypothetical protein
MSKKTLNDEAASASEEHLRRLRRICLGMPGATEKLSHGEPTFFVNKKVFAMFSNNHHNDGHIAVWGSGHADQNCAKDVLQTAVCRGPRLGRN